MAGLSHSPQAFPNVSANWLVGAIVVSLFTAVACGWLALCLLYWQGNWQLLYHPKTIITRTPASIGLDYQPIGFAATETGATQLTGWWIPASGSRFTLLYLHGADGNLSDSVEILAALHHQNLPLFAIDYRGYGQSQASHPNEKQLLQDSEWALAWLTQIRHISSAGIVIYGSGLGANLAAELAADHPELAGVILDQPSADATALLFNDPRSRLVPAHLLVRDRYDLIDPAGRLRLPSLWLMPQPTVTIGRPDTHVGGEGSAGAEKSRIAPSDGAYAKVPGRKTASRLKQPSSADPHFSETLQRWLDDLNEPAL